MKLVVGCTWCSSFSHTRGVQIHWQGCQISTCQWGLPLLVSSKFHVVLMLNDDATIMDDDHVQQLCAEASGLVVGELGHEQHHALHASGDLRDQVVSSLAYAHPLPVRGGNPWRPRRSRTGRRWPNLQQQSVTTTPELWEIRAFGIISWSRRGREVAAAATISPSGSHAKCANSGWHKGGGFFGDYIGDKEAGGDSGKSRNPGDCSGRRAGGLDSDPLMPDLPGHGTTRFAVMVADHVSPPSPPSLPTLESPGKDLEDWDPGFYEAAEHGMLPDGSDINQCQKLTNAAIRFTVELHHLEGLSISR